MHSSNHVKAPMQYCNVSFFFLFFPLVFFFGCLFSYSFVLFYFIFISFRFLLFFLGCCLFQVLFIHSKFFFFFFHLFWFPFFWFIIFLFPSNLLLLFLFLSNKDMRVNLFLYKLHFLYSHFSFIQIKQTIILSSRA